MAFSARTQKSAKRRWVIRQPSPEAGKLAQTLKISPLLAQVLINRGLCEQGPCFSFITPKLTDLIEPARMPGMESAVARIKAALAQKEKITIYGDYDVDGITATAILYQCLTLLGSVVDYYIPHRIEEGYGLNSEAVEQIASSGTNLLITVDCGITAVEPVARAAALGMDVIITDHHQFQLPLPAAAAIVHPLLDDQYPNHASAGAMVAFKLAWALVNEFKTTARAQGPLRDFLINATTLASLGTVADVVDLLGENRILTSYGLKALPDCQLTGVKALLDCAGLTGQSLDSYHIAFVLAPMLNAAGRMGHARLAVELLTSDNQLRSVHISEYLKAQNKQRQQHEKEIFKHACEMVAHAGLDHPDRRSIVLAHESWHIGVIGIVASRMVERYYRPTILLNCSGDLAQGSARSVAGFDILSGIKSCQEHCQSFGGHKMAAGLTLQKEKIGAFAQGFEAYARDNIGHNETESSLHIDALGSVGHFKADVVNQIDLLGPFGQGNPKPIFASKGVKLIAAPRRVGPKGEHLQLSISDTTGAMRCIGFNMGPLEKKVLEQEFFHIAYQPQLNTYNGSTSVQFVLEDLVFE